MCRRSPSLQRWSLGLGTGPMKLPTRNEWVQKGGDAYTREPHPATEHKETPSFTTVWTYLADFTLRDVSHAQRTKCLGPLLVYRI